MLFLMIFSLLNSCKQWMADLDNIFSYWASTVMLDMDSVPGLISDNQGYFYTSSDSNKSINLKIINPGSNQLKMPGDHDAPADIVTFANGVSGSLSSGTPVFDNDYALRQLNANNLELTLTQQFLEKYEWGIKELNPAITLYNHDGRKFGTYTLKLLVNTAPKEPEYKDLGRVETEGKWYYVICLKASEMEKYINNELLHKDLEFLQINSNDGKSEKIKIKINEAGNDFNIAGSKLISAAAVKSLTGAVPTDIGLSHEKWMLCYKTDVEVGGTRKKYSIQLIDKAGLCSPEKPVDLIKPEVINVAGEWKNLKLAVENAKDGDTIIIDGSITAKNDGTNFGEIIIDKNLTIKGKNGKNTDKINANKDTGGKPSHRIFKLESNKELILEGLTLTGGLCSNDDENGAAVLSSGKLKVKNCIFSDNSTGLTHNMGDGGALYIQNGNCEIDDCDFYYNNAARGGAIYVGTNGSCKIGIKESQETRIYKNQASDGGGIYIISTKSDGCIINKGTVIGGEDADNENIALGGAQIGGRGGAIYIGLNANCIINGGVEIKHNKARQGGGIACDLGNLKIAGSQNETVKIINCRANAKDTSNKCGGGIYINGGEVNINYALIQKNIGYEGGGGIYVDSVRALSIKSSSIVNNTAGFENVNSIIGNGGGMYIKHITSIIKINDSLISKNNANGHGGGVYMEAKLYSAEFKDTMISNNIIANNGERIHKGGGIYIGYASKISFLGCDVQNNKIKPVNNSQKQYGAGIYIEDTSAFLSNTMCTVSDLEADSGNKGTIIKENSFENIGDDQACGSGIYVGKNRILHISRTQQLSQVMPIKTGTALNRNDVYTVVEGSNSGKIRYSGRGLGAAAQITPSQYSEQEILSGEENASWHEIFPVTDQAGNSPIKWIVNEDGRLKPLVTSGK